MAQETKTLEFKWTTSRGRDTYGYNICSLWVNGWKVASCNGGGYDMEGTVFGQWLIDNFQDQLKKLTANYGSSDKTSGFYGLIFYEYSSSGACRRHKYQKEYTISIDGACGFSAMTKIANAIGIQLKHIPTKSKNSTIYQATITQGGEN